MLPARHRMRAAEDFAAAIRSGTRGSTRRIVVHYSTESTPALSARVGFVVSKAVGNAVVRNKVKRRLRSVMAGELAALPNSANVVVRALPAAAGADFTAIGADVRTSLSKAQHKHAQRSVRTR